AVAWHAGHVLARLGVHLLCMMALAGGVQVACTAAAWDEGNWLAYHVLTAAWTLTTAATLTAGFYVGAWERESVGAPTALPRSHAPRLGRRRGLGRDDGPGSGCPGPPGHGGRSKSPGLAGCGRGDY